MVEYIWMCIQITILYTNPISMLAGSYNGRLKLRPSLSGYYDTGDTVNSLTLRGGGGKQLSQPIIMQSEGRSFTCLLINY